MALRGSSTILVTRGAIDCNAIDHEVIDRNENFDCECTFFINSLKLNEMDRKKFIVSTALAAVGAFFVSKISGNDSEKNESEKQKENGNEGLGMRGVEGVFSPTNRHMVGNGFKVMNFYPNGKGFEERMSPFFLNSLKLKGNGQKKIHRQHGACSGRCFFCFEDQWER